MKKLAPKKKALEKAKAGVCKGKVTAAQAKKKAKEYVDTKVGNVKEQTAKAVKAKRITATQAKAKVAAAKKEGQRIADKILKKPCKVPKK